ncbi:type II toxin-antitoxin system YafQ family toxin [Methanocorpusculum sp. MG]|uniref:Type II toxin-antitoxin system YafQ family toxin n=1 Tax=Methanocorpusculum petauri TaxID=3002863 RepID=A0ABT4IFR8_9EURY|nr:type II toxin-antitoxin system YafQ family toxin [Methanocorpusculum petauri]MCZ0860224.1 type II toxin-antitoxin system YafQ family toxin [Methanocorpusculum petauri]MDE2443568.1 type II toxin-antitoxin system YafQ family toxin [Methanocorpusculum sp.]
MYAITTTSRFKKDVKVLQKRGYDLTLLTGVIELLVQGERLPRNYLDHGLNGEWSDFRECHIQPDWILIYRIDDEMLVLTLTRTGTHSDLF